ncbi:DedA family protein [Propionicicella superfundia]|uniref:DedA family protein n=1 Tax=Propionicicella superfundia TaxID=348582 RepID=UPI0003F9026F|nr:VTT domain-containing protein [Propionicicella superfundia]
MVADPTEPSPDVIDPVAPAPDGGLPGGDEPRSPATADATDGAPAADDAEIEHWWQAEGMPWQGRKPGRRDIACMALIFAVAAYSLVMLPLRPVMLGFTPHLLAGLGYRTGVVMIGALAATGDPWWPLLLVLASLMAMKFDWIYWWAGKLWGRGIIEMWSGRSARARKRNARAERLALKYETLAILLTYLPIPLPAAVIYAVLGWAGTSLRKFLVVDAIGAVLSTAAYMGLGFLLGAPAVQLIEQYNTYLWYVSLAIVVVMVGSVILNERRRARARDTDDETTVTES